MTFVNDRALEEALFEEDFILVGFLSYGSIPCDHFKPELDALSLHYPAYRLDVDENPKITEELGIQAVPTTVVYRNGEEIAKYEGPYSREVLLERIRALTEPKSEK